MATIDIKTEITGNVWKIVKAVGDSVEEEEPILILESMKMEIPVVSPEEGILKELLTEEELSELIKDQRARREEAIKVFREERAAAKQLAEEERVKAEKEAELAEERAETEKDVLGALGAVDDAPPDLAALGEHPAAAEVFGG